MNRFPKKPLFWIMSIALVVRGVLIFYVAPHPERIYNLDSFTYMSVAQNLIRGNGYSQDSAPPYEPDAVRTPGYPLFLAAVYAIAGENQIAVLIVQVVVSTLTVGLAYLVGEKLFTKKVALLGSLLLALDVGSVSYSLQILTETLFTFIFVLVMLLLVVHHIRPKTRFLMLAGALTGVVILIRPIALYYPVLVIGTLLWLYRGRWGQALKTSAIYAISTLIIFIPWMIRNTIAIDIFTISSISEYNLLYYNAASLEADLNGISDDQARAILIDRVDDEMAKRGLSTESEKFNLFPELAREIILAHPWRYILVHLKHDVNNLLPNFTKLLELVGFTVGRKGTHTVLNQYGVVAAIRNYFGGQLWLLFLAIPFGVLLGLNYLGMLVGLFVLTKKRDIFSVLLLFLPVAYFLLIPGAPSHPRFRVPVMPHICLLAGFGLMTLYTKYLNRYRKTQLETAS